MTDQHALITAAQELVRTSTAPGRNSSDWLTPQQVGQMAGFSDSQIRAEIKAGELRAVQRWSRAGKLCRYWVSRDEAMAYLSRLNARGPQREAV